MSYVPRCRSCDAPIRWMRTVAGKLMPLDLEPRDDGNVVVTNDHAVVLRKGETVPDGTPRFVSHHFTCPNAKRHRGIFRRGQTQLEL